MKLTDNKDFFKVPLASEPKQDIAPQTNAVAPSEKKVVNKINASASVAQLIKQTSDTLLKCGLTKMSKCVDKVISDASKERFNVAVVGEFSRGKSTFVNNLLENAIELPVGNLPTTAVMTRIRYSKRSQMAVFDEKGVKIALMELKKDSWDSLVANNFGEQQPKGSVIVGVPSKWLAINSLEIIDCPGAGDLSEERTQQIIDTLDRADAAIINISATSPFSMTEKEFILQRILKRKTPFSMVIINKLDLIKKEERNDVVKHIIDVLVLNKMSIPVFIPSDVEMSDDTYSSIQGLDKIRSVITSWANDPKRQALTDLWIKSRTQDIVSMAIETLKEQQKIYDADNIECQNMILKKKTELSKLDLLWGELELNMQNRSNKCYTSFLEKVEEYKTTIVERLQFEAAHSGSPEKWWKDDYPYRLKVELANMSVGIDNVISKMVATDAAWFNQTLEQKFKSFVQVGSISIADKLDYTSTTSERKVEFENLTKKQNVGRLATAGLTIAGYIALAGVTLGGAPLAILASMGIGTGSTLIQSGIFKKKLEDQRGLLKAEIAKDIPLIIDKATEKSEGKIQALYDKIIAESSQKKALWVEAQNSAIDANNKPKSEAAQNNICSSISELNVIISKLN